MKHHVVLLLDDAWRLSHAKYIKMLKEIALTGSVTNIDKYGKHIGPAVNLFHLSPTDARALLKELLK